MKKKIIPVIFTLGILSILLTGCCLSHDWQEATCTNPKTCSKCGKTDGDALGHSWQEATCTVPQTCSVCGETEGEALGHKWQEATCMTAKTCSVCGETEGEALGHSWQKATCQTPKTCSVCGIQEGGLGEHKVGVEATYWSAAKCNICGALVGEPLVPAFEQNGIRINAFSGGTYDYLTGSEAGNATTG